MTGIVPRPPLITLALAPVGRFALTESRAAFSESVTFAAVIPKSKVTRTVDRELWLVEDVVVTPSRDSTEDSINLLTWVSITSGDAPGYVVTIAA
jgi:hypothetical protein